MVEAAVLSRAQRELAACLVKVGTKPQAGTSAMAALQTFKRNEREAREREYEKVTKDRRIAWDAVTGGVVDHDCTIQVHSLPPRPGFYVCDPQVDDKGQPVIGKDGHQVVVMRPYMTDDECALAALRSLAHAAKDYGPDEAWLVRGRLFGSTVTAVYRGPLSALRSLWPDLAMRKRLQQAGAKDLDTTVGLAVYVERLPRAVPRRRRALV